MGSQDRIEIRRIRANGRHGALPGERDEPQPFEIDLDVYVDLSAAEFSDELGETVDYGAISLMVVGLVATTSFSLIEALAGAIADEILDDPRVDRVEVTLRKVRPPIRLELESVGVRLVRDRS